MTEQAIALIFGMSCVILSIIIMAAIVGIAAIKEDMSNMDDLPNAVNISDCDCKAVKSVEPDKRLPFNDWAKRYIRPFSNAKPKR